MNLFQFESLEGIGSVLSMVPKESHSVSHVLIVTSVLSILLKRFELKEIYNAAPPIATGSVLVSTKIKRAFLKASGLGGDVEEIVEEIEKEVDVGPGGKRLSAIGEDCPVYVNISVLGDRADHRRAGATTR